MIVTDKTNILLRYLRQQLTVKVCIILKSSLKVLSFGLLLQNFAFAIAKNRVSNEKLVKIDSSAERSAGYKECLRLTGIMKIILY